MEIVDLTYIREMSGDSQDIIKEMIQIFLEQVPEFLEEMNSCHSREDWHNLGMIAHKAKSSVAIMGMTKESDDLRTLEILAREGKEAEKYLPIIESFEESCNKAVKELKIVLNT